MGLTQQDYRMLALTAMTQPDGANLTATLHGIVNAIQSLSKDTLHNLKPDLHTDPKIDELLIEVTSDPGISSEKRSELTRIIKGYRNLLPDQLITLRILSESLLLITGSFIKQVSIAAAWTFSRGISTAIDVTELDLENLGPLIGNYPWAHACLAAQNFVSKLKNSTFDKITPSDFQSILEMGVSQEDITFFGPKISIFLGNHLKLTDLRKTEELFDEWKETVSEYLLDKI